MVAMDGTPRAERSTSGTGTTTRRVRWRASGRRLVRSVAAPDSPIRRGLPDPAKDALRAVRRRLPTRLVHAIDRQAGRTVPPSDGTAAAEFDAALRAPRPAIPGTPVRLLVAPANFAGQGWQWAQAAQRHLPGVGALSMAVAGPMRFTTDYEVPHAVTQAIDWQRTQERWVTSQFTHVLIEAERPVFGPLYARTCDIDARRLVKAGIAVALISHGSDIRVPSQHRREHPYSPFTDPGDPAIAVLETVTRRNRGIITGFAGPTFVSTPDLLRYAPDATWCPVVIDPQAWACDVPVLERDRPRVVHVPSSGPLKGSDLIDPILRELDAEGVVEYRTLRGLTHEQMRDAYRGADIVLDQFVLGLYGVAAAEAMAAGRICLGYVTEPVRQVVTKATGWDVPVVEADPGTIRDVLLGLLADRDAARRIAAEGPSFVREVHDGRRSAEVLRRFLLG